MKPIYSDIISVIEDAPFRFYPGIISRGIVEILRKGEKQYDYNFDIVLLQATDMWISYRISRSIKSKVYGEYNEKY